MDKSKIQKKWIGDLYLDAKLVTGISKSTKGATLKNKKERETADKVNLHKKVKKTKDKTTFTFTILRVSQDLLTSDRDVKRVDLTKRRQKIKKKEEGQPTMKDLGFDDGGEAMMDEIRRMADSFMD